jgi:DNA-binding response OmpR family regulator
MSRILITDDDELTANICRRKFEEAGFEVAVARDGHEAIEKLVLQTPDVLLLDLMLPELDGVGVLRFVRSRPRLMALPVVILSNSTYFSGLAQAAWHAGATLFFNKADSTPNMLVEEVTKLLAAAAAAAPPPARPEPAASPFPPSNPSVAAGGSPPPLPPSGFGTPAAAAPPSRTGPLRIMVADDDPLIQGVLSFFLKQAGFLVTSAANGRQALDQASATPPDLLVLDGMMPELDGFEVLRHWQRTAGLAQIPVIMLTGEKDQARMSEALGGGAIAYLTKPFSPDELVKRVIQATSAG